MKLSKRFIIQVAEELRERQGKFTQIELHKAIEKKIERNLTPDEKRRITMILRYEYVIEDIERDPEFGYSRIYIFF